MLRITIENNLEAAAIKLEGKLRDAWVDELERTWYVVRSGNSRKSILLDLCDVTFIDAEGTKLLTWMCGEGATFKASGCVMKETVQEIKRECEHSRKPS